MAPALAVATLVFITVIWGTTFVVVKGALDDISVPLLLALRFTLAALLLSWVRIDRRALVPALVLGLLAFAGFATQTIGLSITTASKAAFITGLSVVITPMVAAAFLRQRIGPRVHVAAVLATSGLGLMTLTGVSGVNAGDVWVVGAAVAYALYIVYLGEVANRVGALSLAGLQHWPMAGLAWLWALPALPELTQLQGSTYASVIYLGAVATALVAVLHTYAQRVVPAHLAALIFVLEPVFAAAFAYALLGETLGLLGWVGGILIVVAMLVTEMRFKRPVGAGSAPVREPAALQDG